MTSFVKNAYHTSSSTASGSDYSAWTLIEQQYAGVKHLGHSVYYNNTIPFILCKNISLGYGLFFKVLHIASYRISGHFAYVETVMHNVMSFRFMDTF